MSEETTPLSTYRVMEELWIYDSSMKVCQIYYDPIYESTSLASAKEHFLAAVQEHSLELEQEGVSHWTSIVDNDKRRFLITRGLVDTPSRFEYRELVDTKAAHSFHLSIVSKLKRSREKGRDGWEDPALCSVPFLVEQFYEHLEKGNEGTYEDLACYLMMLHARGEDPSCLITHKPKNNG